VAGIVRVLIAQAIFLGAHCTPAFAKEAPAHYKLFESRGEPVALYDQIVRNIRPGDTVEFSNGQSFAVKNILGFGSSSLILGISDTEVLRIPIAGTPGVLEIAYITIDGYKHLEKFGVPVAHLDLNNSYAPEYILAERISTESKPLRLQEWLRQNSFEADKVQALMNLAQATADFQYIEDFREFNIVWSGSAWVLVDWRANFELAQRSNQRTAFEEILDARRKLRHSPSIRLLEEANRQILAVRMSCEYRLQPFPSIMTHRVMGPPNPGLFELAK